MKKLFTLFVSLNLCLSLPAQNISGQGSVTDQNMNPVSNAVVTFTQSAPPYTVHQFVCDSAGYYSFDFPLQDTITGINELYGETSRLIVTNNGGQDHCFYFTSQVEEKTGSIEIYSLTGARIAVFEYRSKPLGSPVATWNGNGGKAGTGIYYYSAAGGKYSGKLFHVNDPGHNEIHFNLPSGDESSDANNKNLSQTTDFSIHVSPSVQSLQFYETDEIFTLAEGNNGLLLHEVLLLTNGGLRLTVVDTNSNPVEGAEVILYDTKRKWRIDSCRLAPPFYTDANGQVEITALLPQEYWFNVYMDDMHNRFTTIKTDTIVDTTLITDINVLIRPLTDNEILLCGPSDNKTWITTQVLIYGTIPMQYDADSKLYHDGTWDDSNGRSGFWWFTANETQLIYDYDVAPGETPLVIVCDLVELTDSTFIGDMIFQGLPVVYYMEAVYD